MSRLRRQSHCAHSIPVAAEVLESRALLSAGAAAVHAATQHAAALHPATHHSTQTTIPSFQGSVITAFAAAGGAPTYMGADLSVSSFSPTTGASMSAHFKHFIKSGNLASAITGTFKGKITAVNPLGGSNVEYDVQDVGSLTFSGMGQKFTAAPDGPLKLYSSGGLFDELKVSVVFPASAGGGLANVHFSFDLTLDID
jgi:hypothetical protein